MKLIHLDANYPIAYVNRSHEFHDEAVRNIDAWMQPDYAMGMSFSAWEEFLSGDRSPRSAIERSNFKAMLKAGIILPTESHADLAVELYHRAGRSSKLRRDSAIAATAVLANATLATFNVRDFLRFQEPRLRILGMTSIGDQLAQQSAVSPGSSQQSL